MKVSEFVADFIAGLQAPEGAQQRNVYGICGAGAMHLNDAICHHPGIRVVPMQHEQAATFAAECEARLHNTIGIVHVTAGPGGSNTLTGVACAWVDSIPLLIIAGQVTSHTMRASSGLRQGGMNELPMVDLMQPITKYAATVTDPYLARYQLERAVWYAMNGRRGPVFLEFPLDIQGAEFDPVKSAGYAPSKPLERRFNIEGVEKAVAAAERPVVIVGNGVRLADACPEFVRMAAALKAPVVTSWGAADIMPPFSRGRCGIFGDRRANWTVQNADLILAIGTRLSVAQIGHHAKLFAPNATKIVVDIDGCEASKLSISADLVVEMDAKIFLEKFRPPQAPREWLEQCKIEAPEPAHQSMSYKFVNELGKHIDPMVVVTDVGFCFIPTMQVLKLRYGQRLIHSHGVSPMGWALPAAIGAAMSGASPVICLVGDGGLMLNLQELYTVVEYNLPIAIVVYCNNGYATMRIAQNNHFKRESMDPKISADMLLRVARGFGLPCIDVKDMIELPAAVQAMFRSVKLGPIFVALRLPENEVIAPRVQAAMEDGRFKPVTLTEQWPPIETEELVS